MRLQIFRGPRKNGVLDAKIRRTGAVNTSRVPRPTNPGCYGQITSRTPRLRLHFELLKYIYF